MVYQELIIKLIDENYLEIGILHIKAKDSRNNNEFESKVSDSMFLKNISRFDPPDNLTPIQYCENLSSNFAKLMLLEETEYQILFESNDVNANYEILYSLNKINNNYFKLIDYDLSSDEKFIKTGTLNFRSYVGKSFLDVKKDEVLSFPIPIEVRSKKLDYFNQYSAMIADLSQQSLNLIFEVNSPLYQEFELNLGKRETFYEDFMFLEFLFREENLPSIFEYLSNNLHSRLKSIVEDVPLSFASNVNHNTLKNIISKPNNLFKSDVDYEIVDNLNGFIPFEIEQVKHEDIIDIPENRFFKYFLELIQNLIEKLLDNPVEGYTYDQLLYFRDEIEYYLSSKFFNQISPLDFVPFNSQILQKKEGYREIFHYFLMLEFSFKFGWDEINDHFKGFEKKLSDLYEYWCYFKLLKVLNDLSINKINFEDVFIINKNNWSISIKKGKDSMKQFKLRLYDFDIEIKLFYNLKFSKNKKYRSYSLPFKPDYTLIITIGKKEYYVHFDAKYRSEVELINFYDIVGSEQVSDEKIDERDSLEEKDRYFKDGDIYKMHTYKDSILNSEGAYVLYPGNKDKRFYESNFIIPSVGAFPLTPGNDDVEEGELEKFIKEVLKTFLLDQRLIPLEWVSTYLE